MKLRQLNVAIAIFLLVSACARLAQAQAGHLGHHPAPGGTATPPASDSAMPAGSTAPASQSAPMSQGATAMPGAGAQPAAAGASGMTRSDSPGPAPAAGAEGGMGEMMKQMGTPPPKELYPTLMALPDGVTPEERARIDQLAQERMKSGSAMLSSGLAKLSDSTSNEDYPSMQQATEQMRVGLAEFEAGIAARRVLAEGSAPRNLALDWFKREMNLASPTSDRPRTFLGVAPFHLVTMVLLVAFGLSMLAMYFFKMRRAAALFGRLGPDANAPPGSAPPLAGKPGAANAS